MTYTPSFHNTTGVVGRQLDLFEDKAEKQDVKILKWFRRRYTESFSPSQIHKLIFTSATPITSTRRAINTLTKLGFLYKTKTKTIGPYGREEHQWALRLEL